LQSFVSRDNKMATSNFMSAIEPLSKEVDFSRWVQRFEAVKVLQDWSDEKSKYAFLACIGQEAFDLLADAAMPKEPSELKLEELKDLLKQQLQPKQLPIAARYQFQQLKQGGDGVQAYIRRLRHSAEACQFGKQLDERLRDQFVFGLANQEAVRRMLTEKLEELTLQRAVDLASSFETVQREHKGFGKSNSEVTGSSNLFATTVKKKNEEKSKNREIVCYCCGKKGHMRNECRFKDSTCNSCKRKGHLKAVCRGPKERINAIEESIDILSLGKTRFIKKVFINSLPVEMIFDTGAEVSIINEATYNDISSSSSVRLNPAKSTITAYGGSSVKMLGKIETNISVGDMCNACNIFVSKGNSPNIYGCDLIKLFEPNFTVNAVEDNKVSFSLKESVVPKFVKPRVIPYGLREKVKEELDRLVKEGTVVEVKESDWATPIVPVLKPNGSVRICGDYKVTLNPALKEMICTTPAIEDVINSTNGSNYFSEIDLTSAFHQLELSETSSLLTTISTPFGLFRYTRLPFGVKQSPAIFQNFVERKLFGIDGVEIYQDNFYIHAPTKQLHDERLKEVIKRLEDNCIKINQEKSSFSKREISILGTIISASTARPDPEKVKAIKSFRSPTKVTEVRSFLGLLEFYGRFISNLATLKEPLTRLLHKNTKFVWGSEQQKAFEKLKSCVCSESLLGTYDPKKQITVRCDASPVGVAAVLEQDNRPILFVSKTLTTAERAYAQVEREGLAVVWAVRRLHKYLYGKHFLLVTDNKAISHIFSPDKAVPPLAAARIQRWSLFLMAYDFHLEHIRGSQNEVADAISRLCRDPPAQNFDLYNVQETLNKPPVSKHVIRQAQKVDSDSKELFRALRDGNRVAPEYYRFRDELTIHDGCIYRQYRLVIPVKLRKRVLCLLHEAHIGIDAMKSLARQCIWWPSIDKDIEKKVRECESCCVSKCNTRAQWKSWPESTERWQRVHIDHAGPLDNGKYLLVMVDAFTKWPEVHVVNTINSSETIRRLRRTFSQMGVPETIVSDNGPSFVSKEIEEWFVGIGCKHLRTPPYHPRSNGLAERFIRTLKDHIRATRNQPLDATVDRFLLQYRNSKHSTTGEAPATRMTGRLLRCNLTSLQRNKVWVRRYNDAKSLWEPGHIVNQDGQRIVHAQLPNGSTKRYHVEQTKPRYSSDSELTDEACDEDEHEESSSQQRTRRPPERYGVVPY